MRDPPHAAGGQQQPPVISSARLSVQPGAAGTFVARGRCAQRRNRSAGLRAGSVCQLPGRGGAQRRPEREAPAPRARGKNEDRSPAELPRAPRPVPPPSTAGWARVLTAESFTFSVNAEHFLIVCELAAGRARRFATVGCFVTVLQQGTWEQEQPGGRRSLSEQHTHVATHLQQLPKGREV